MLLTPSDAMSNLNTRAWISLVVLEVVLAIVLFACAGTTRYWQGWAYLLLLFVMAAGITVDMMRRDRGLLERRMKGGLQRSRVRCSDS